MKVRSVEFDDEEVPARLTVEMSLDEAAAIYALTGYTPPKDVTDALGNVRWGNASADVADCLSGAFFNRFYEGGARDVVRPVGGARRRIRLTVQDREAPR